MASTVESAPASTTPPTAASPSAPPEASAPAPTQTVPPAAETQPKPVSVLAPSIDIDEPLIELGLAADGTAEVPSDYDDAGWLSTGGRPGAIGPTLILGHVDSKAGPAVFYRLKELQPGDVVSIGLENGETADYQVTEVAQYPKDEFPTIEVYGATIDDVLRLVTCGGAFDSSASSYVDNIIVTATRIAGEA